MVNVNAADTVPLVVFDVIHLSNAVPLRSAGVDHCDPLSNQTWSDVSFRKQVVREPDDTPVRVGAGGVPPPKTV